MNKRDKTTLLKKCVVKAIIMLILYIGIYFGLTNQIHAATSSSVITSGSHYQSTFPSSMKKIVTTSEGTIHAFIPVGTASVDCGGNSLSGTLWFYSTDTGSTWICGGQLSSETSQRHPVSAAVDSSDNIYVVYSYQSIYYRKLTKGVGSTWTLGAEQLAFQSSSSLNHYSFPSIEVEGTDRLWLTFRYYESPNYMLPVYYSDGLSDSPTWTMSSAALDYPASDPWHYPTVIRFGNRTGVIYNAGYPSQRYYWRFRNDSDPLTYWTTQTIALNQPTYGNSNFVAKGTPEGNVYLAALPNTTLYFTYWNGYNWSYNTIVTSTAVQTVSVGLATDGGDVILTYADSSGLISSLSGNRRLVYKKGVMPFASSNFDTIATTLVDYHTSLDKYWSVVSSAWLDDTVDAGDTDTGDTRMVTGINDAAYFGRLQKFDSLSWVLSTNGSAGVIAWEYWNGSTWSSLTLTSSSNTNLNGTGYLAFTDPSDWQTTSLNAEGSSYYYIRARVETGFSTSPTATQIVSIPATYFVNSHSALVSGNLYNLWTENASSLTKARFKSTPVATSTPNTSSSADIPSAVAYSTNSGATQVSTRRPLVKTSDGTLHAFVQAGSILACGTETGTKNNLGLVWVYSTDSGANWNCGEQLSPTESVNASATVDSLDNIYVIYSYSTTGGSTFYNIYYRKLTKGSGKTWTLGNEQVVASGSTATGYTYSVAEVEGTTRLWVASRYYDGTNYQVSVFYSDNLSGSPTWTLSSQSLGTAGDSNLYSYPVIVRFGTNIGVLYNSQSPQFIRWRYRADSDSLTTWAEEEAVNNYSVEYPIFSAVGDSLGYVYLASSRGTNRDFFYWNGSVWSSGVNLAPYQAPDRSFVSISTYNQNVWVYYGETTGLSYNRRIVYKKGVYPYTASDFDTNSTNLMTKHGTFDKYWSYVSGSYLDDTEDSISTTTADTRMVTGVGDIAYFGKIEKFDNVYWTLSTGGAGGQVVWEYWNGSDWISIDNMLYLRYELFTITGGYITFVPNTNWTKTSINGEAESYYYVRARVTVPYTTSPVATQLTTLPMINWLTSVANTPNLYTMWTENVFSPYRVSFTSVDIPTAPYLPTSLGPPGMVDGSGTTDTTPTLTFDISDPNISDTVKYHIQIDDTADFSSPVVDYISALAAQGSFSFTVGQAAGSGTYTIGNEGQTLSGSSYYWRVLGTDNSDQSSSYVTANYGSIAFIVDTTLPVTNASDVVMLRAAGSSSVSSNEWVNGLNPYFSWAAGSDNEGGSGVKGYCLYLGTDESADPATAKGLLGTSPISTSETTCQFIVSNTAIDFANSSYKGETWLSTSNLPYYLNVKVIDNAGNVISDPSAQFQFRFDNTVPVNVTYTSCASGNFSNVVDMNFSWPVTGSSASSDANSGLLGWQYQINSSSGTWVGMVNSPSLGIDYIPITENSRTLSEAQDGPSIVSGSNLIYFRTVDIAGNYSSSDSIRICSISYGGAAPLFNPTDSITVNPSSSSTNLYSLSWPAAAAAEGNNVTHYYYMVNTPPPSTLATLQGNSSTFIDNGNSLTVDAADLPNVNKGSNTVYVVAIDDAETPNYSPSNYITGTFTLNSTDPDNVGNLSVSDSSIKSQSLWNVTLTWSAPVYQGAGNLTYIIKRSIDNVTFNQIGTSSGLSYVDNTPDSELYYYKVYTQDGANATSSGTNAVFITPTGKWTSAPELDSDPVAESITTKKATITWSTSRSSDTKVQFGTATGKYNSVELSNSSHVTSHSIQLIGLNPETTYYYRAKWTDEDGNTGTSDEKIFTTSPAPTVKDPQVKNIGLSSSTIQYTTTGASSVKIYYGTTTAFGGIKTLSTSEVETTYTTELTGLTDGTKYYYKINTVDSESSEYEGNILTFETLPRPRITNVRIQQVANTAQSTILVTWNSNTEISSVITYYPEGQVSEARDEVNVTLVKGEHKMIIRDLKPETVYMLVVKGRDKIGNEALSDTQKVTTAIDTRPPQITDLHVEGTTVPPISTTAQIQSAQFTITWNTDELSTSQVEFGEGTGTTYTQKTKEDGNLVSNHIVIISNLTPSKVYHLRTVSKDKAGNIGYSIDTVRIAPKATDNALNLVITNLAEVFKFLKF